MCKDWSSKIVRVCTYWCTNIVTKCKDWLVTLLQCVKTSCNIIFGKLTINNNMFLFAIVAMSLDRKSRAEHTLSGLYFQFIKIFQKHTYVVYTFVHIYIHP